MSVFLTGFPGFLGSALVDRLLDRRETVRCLVQPKFRDAAESRAAEIAGDDWQDAIELYEGDITEPGLGLSDDARETILAETDELFHLAAVYDLAVDRAVGEAVNVDGTRHVLDVAENCDLDRLHYVSTCYVSGRHDGVFGPDDLDVGQSFNNHYEATKFEAEVLVQDRMADGLPATVYRPAITVGDSETGETQKYDGPYFVMRWLQRCPGVAPLPAFPGRAGTELNVVPRNFVVDAIDHLSEHGDADTVYQLCDANPPTIPELTRVLADVTDTRVLPIPATLDLAKRLLGTEFGRSLAGIPPEALDYFTHPTTYVAPNTRRDLAGSGVSCPAFESYVDVLAAYAREHPEVGSAAMT
ncbi:SDR family oxidoreductase [Halobacterium jilantaiense]|uniref:Male sterility protein n=1 Tax=Halobacterium jilantaiense TaxID=355548 RepID=A0A1I0Q168_9EURY|nr:SDR family oxidoreductase [Halobacterium jilantaiense]SEW20276.1 Male sterility protein [Halobacterium jilantaiense]